MSSRYAYLIAAVAAISGLLFGFDTAVINGALLFLRQDLQLSTRGTETLPESSTPRPRPPPPRRRGRPLPAGRVGRLWDRGVALWAALG